MSRVAVVTGSNRGIGFGLIRGLCQKFDGIVYLTSRDEKRGREAVEELKRSGLRPEYQSLDVNDRESIKEFRDFIKEKHGGLDILINNAGVVEEVYKTTTYEDSLKVINNNYKSVLTMRELIYPLVRNNGRILNISSDCGHLSNVKNEYWIQRLSSKDLTVQDVDDFVDWFLEAKKHGTFNATDIANGMSLEAYRVSKVALSAVTIIHQKELANRNISVNSIHPGFVRTDMTGYIGFYSIDQAVNIPLYLVLEAPQSLKGAYVWHDGNIIDWYDHKTDYFLKFKSDLKSFNQND